MQASEFLYTSPANRRIQRAFEAGWILAVVLVPLASWPESEMLGFIQIPKVFLMRTIAMYFLALLALEWAISNRNDSSSNKFTSNRIRHYLQAHPSRLLLLAAGLVFLANIFSVANSPIPAIGILGIDVGWDTYGIANTTGFIIFFYTIATHLKTTAQVQHLIWALTLTGAIVGLVAIGQHFGIDIFRTAPFVLTRAHSTLGNSIFAGSFLIMTIPLTLLVFLEYRSKMSYFTHVSIGGGLVALQMTGLLFALSRGPMVGMISIIVTLLALLLWLKKSELAVRVIAMFAIALLFALIMTTLPTPDRQNFGGNDLVDRVSSIGPGIGGSLSNRYTIWTTAINAWGNVPWVDTEEFPELPDIGLSITKPIFGYGPDMFQHAYPLVGESTYTFELASHGHSFLIHALLEIGLFGMLAYVSLALSAGFILIKIINKSRKSEELSFTALASIGLFAILIGRVIEQIPGKAQVSDLLIMWTLLAVIAALPLIEHYRTEASAPIDNSSPQRKRTTRRSKQTTSYQYRLVVPAILTVILIIIWYNFVLAQPLSAMTAKDAEQAAESGQIQKSLDLYRDAQSASPHSAIYYLKYAEILFELSKVAPTTAEKNRLTERAIIEVSEIIKRNPMDNRAWSRIAEMEKSLAKDNPEKKRDAFHSNMLIKELMPGFWQPSAALAWTYAELGEYERALDEVENAAALSANANASAASQATFIPFVEAFALDGLGRTAEAIDAVNRSLEMRRTQPAEELLKRLLSK